MKKFSVLILVSFFSLNIVAQKNDAVKLLFRDVKTTLTTTEKNLIYQKTGFNLSKDKKQFVMGDDPASMDYPFAVQVLPTDMNKDGKEEIFMVFGNSYTSGATGSNVLLFIKDKAGVYQANFGFSGTTPDIMPTKNLNYPDLLIGGPGFEFPVWRWNGKDYVFNRKISDKNLGKMKTISVEEASKTYVSSIKQ